MQTLAKIWVVTPCTVSRWARSMPKAGRRAVRGLLGTVPEVAHYRQGRDLPAELMGWDLRGCDFRDLDLRGHDFTGSDLSYCDLRGALLNPGQLDETHRHCACFEGAPTPDPRAVAPELLDVYVRLSPEVASVAPPADVWASWYSDVIEPDGGVMHALCAALGVPVE